MRFLAHLVTFAAGITAAVLTRRHLPYLLVTILSRGDT